MDVDKNRDVSGMQKLIKTVRAEAVTEAANEIGLLKKNHALETADLAAVNSVVRESCEIEASKQSKIIQI